MLVVKYTKYNLAPHIYALSFKDLSIGNLDDFVSADNIKHVLIESAQHVGEKKEWIGDLIANSESYTVQLDNGAEAALLVPGGIDKNQDKLPLFVNIHGGPFSSSPLNWCTMIR